MPLTMEDRRRNGSKGAWTKLANSDDWTAATEAARAAGPGQLEYHERKVDPEGLLPPEQRRKMAEAAKKVYFIELAEKSRQARAARRASGGQA